MNVEIWTEAAQFPEKEYIIGIFVAVWWGHKYKDKGQGIFCGLEVSLIFKTVNITN